MKLFGYWRSSASYRVRIALALKGVDYDYQPINLLAGEQQEPDFLSINPLGLVPALKTDDGDIIVQSLAIMEYLEEAYPDHAILPKAPAARGAARAMAASIACEAQPFMNLRIQKYLKSDGGFDDAQMAAWLNRWPGGAMAAVEKMAAQWSDGYCVGGEPTIADCCLVPQMFAANRFGIDTTQFPTLTKIADRCAEHPAFIKAHPDNQPDKPRD